MENYKRQIFLILVLFLSSNLFSQGLQYPIDKELTYLNQGYIKLNKNNTIQKGKSKDKNQYIPQQILQLSQDSVFYLIKSPSYVTGNYEISGDSIFFNAFKWDYYQGNPITYETIDGDFTEIQILDKHEMPIPHAVVELNQGLLECTSDASMKYHTKYYSNDIGNITFKCDEAIETITISVYAIEREYKIEKSNGQKIVILTDIENKWIEEMENKALYYRNDTLYERFSKKRKAVEGYFFTKIEHEIQEFNPDK